MTGVEFHPSRHGTWWRAWWDANKSSFPESVRDIEVPDYPKTAHGKQFAERIKGQPVILVPTLDDLLKMIHDEVAAGTDVDWTVEWIASYENPRAIEPLIKLLAEGQTKELRRPIERTLRSLTEVDEWHDARWWTNWWEENRADVNRRIAETVEPPSGNMYVPKHRRELPEGDDVRDIPAADTLIGGDERKRYVLIGPKEESNRPPDGWRLLLILAGGDGGPGFHPFTKRIYKNVLAEKYLAAHVIAPEWSREQTRKITWPTKTDPWRGMKFSTEELVEAVIDHVQSKHQIDDRFVFTLSWSSSGPAAYAISLHENTRVTGSFVAMSVFRPDWLPPLERAKGHRYFILHSPDDWIKIEQAREAERRLTEEGAEVGFMMYKGGHGWRDDPYGKMRAGLAWLESQVARGSTDVGPDRP